MALALLTVGPQADLQGQSQSAVPTNTPFELMKKKWDLVPDGELLAAAQTNNAQAQFFYWRRETDQALEDQSRFWSQYVTLKRTLPPDEQKSLLDKWTNTTDEELTKEGERGDVEAKIVLSYRKSNAAIAHALKLFSFVEKSADQGFPPAEGEAATYYLLMSGHVLTEPNQAKGLELLRRAADAGWAKAQSLLATIYLEGKLLQPDAAKAVEYFQKAADQDGPRAQYELAMLYANGCGVPRGNDDAPVVLLRKSAAKANVPALHELGERYRIGLGVSVDYAQAAGYYQKAWQASQSGGYDPQNIGGAMFNLVDGDLAPNPGLGRELVPFAKFLSVYLKATLRHDGAAMSQIGQWYFVGHFVPKDKVEAFRWLKVAADFGSADSRKRRDEIKSKLSPVQLEQALKPPEMVELTHTNHARSGAVSVPNRMPTIPAPRANP
ncbi:MAG: SEL1-like repeat protein [Verrucomicrobiota bacterium]